jgi:hypothetical protein
MWFDTPSPGRIPLEGHLPVKRRIDDARAELAAIFENSLARQQAVATDNVQRLRRVHPDKTPAELVKYLDMVYLTAVSASGVAAGATAAAGPRVSIPSALADVVAFTEASVLYVLSVAEVHDLHPEDIERRRLLVMAVMLGDAATGAVNKAAGRIGPHWAKQIISAIPMPTINKINGILGPRFVTKYGAKQGVLVLGKQLPRGIGAALGGTSNHLIGRGIIKSARSIFGEVPAGWPDR